MREHRLEVADVFRTYEKEFFAKWGHVISPCQQKAFNAIRDCGTAALGGHVEYVEQCDTCGHRVISYPLWKKTAINPGGFGGKAPQLRPLPPTDSATKPKEL
jgi:hypothetical protein